MTTKGGPFPGERFLAHRAISAAIGKAAKDNAPMQANDAILMAGAQIYTQNDCADCHGRLGDKDTGMGRRIYPHAPHLLPPSKGVTDDPVGMTHWVVQNGIRFSGMPSFQGKLSEDEMWQVSLLLRDADKLPPAVQAVLSAKNSAE